MKIPLSWISLYTPLSPLTQKYAIKELAHEYSIHTAEIDGIEEHFLDKVVVGKVISCEKHPESKKLSIVRVTLGELGEETILTGAANIVDAKYVAVAVVGAVLPGDFVIGERMMAGMMSRGMICSDDELGLATERAEGIMILEEHWTPEVLESILGQSFFDLTLPFVGKNGETYQFPLRDTTFEIDNKFITNRPDLFSVVGNAREFHAVFDIPFTPYESKDIKKSSVLDTKIETNRVLSYHLLKMEGITVGKSPFGMSVMMERAGLTPKMDIVDITNCIMTELGQPMHAFDADKVVGNITVRLAKTGEKILALNGTEYTLTSEDVVIADENWPIAIAGVIGGMESAVSETTRNIIWESACFDASSVRLTAQRHGIRTDASTRYEKSLDPLLAGTTFPRVMEYMNFLGKNYTETGYSEYIDTNRVNHITIDVTYDFLNKKAGVEIPSETVQNILKRLGFWIQTKESGISVTVPSWRASKDVNIKEDIAEEVARVYGYDNVPYTALDANFSIGKKNEEINLRNLTHSHFSERGWHEVYNYSFSSEVLDRKIGFSDMESAIRIQNAFNEEYTHMTRSLAPRLFLDVNHNQKYSDTFAFYEIGKVYEKTGKRSKSSETLLKATEKKPFPERKILAGVALGHTIVFVREAIETYLVSTLGYIPPVHQGSSGLPFLHPGISGQYSEDNIILARFGKIHPETAHEFEINEETLYFEIDYEAILELHRDKDERFHEISRFQTIPRELNFLLGEHTPTAEVARIIDAVHPWIQDLRVDSIYTDEAKLGKGIKSVNFAFILSNREWTISDDEAMSVQNLIIETLQTHGFALRS